MIKNNVKVFFSLYISLNDKKGAKDICLKTRCTKNLLVIKSYTTDTIVLSSTLN